MSERYISVRDLQRKCINLRNEIRKCRNTKVKARLVEEEAAYTITLRNFKHIKIEEKRWPE